MSDIHIFKKQMKLLIMEDSLLSEEELLMKEGLKQQMEKSEECRQLFEEACKRLQNFSSYLKTACPQDVIGQNQNTPEVQEEMKKVQAALQIKISGNEKSFVPVIQAKEVNMKNMQVNMGGSRAKVREDKKETNASEKKSNSPQGDYPKERRNSVEISNNRNTIAPVIEGHSVDLSGAVFSVEENHRDEVCIQGNKIQGETVGIGGHKVVIWKISSISWLGILALVIIVGGGIYQQWISQTPSAISVDQIEKHLASKIERDIEIVMGYWHKKELDRALVQVDTTLNFLQEIIALHGEKPVKKYLQDMQQFKILLIKERKTKDKHR